jgi:hypothetical protein
MGGTSLSVGDLCILPHRGQKEKAAVFRGCHIRLFPKGVRGHTFEALRNQAKLKK